MVYKFTMLVNMWRFICCALLYLGFVATQSSLYSTSFAYHDGAPQTFQVPSGIKDGTLLYNYKVLLVEIREVDWAVS